jgi:deoxyribodipyrimidine photo-lyase
MLNVFWFRRDLRLEDNSGLYHALKAGIPVLPVFIFDELILAKLEDKQDARVNFIYQEMIRLKSEIEKTGSSLMVRYGNPELIFTELIQSNRVSTVFANHDYEPYARERDGQVEHLLKLHGINFITHKDQVIFEKDEVVKDSGDPYTVFTPYSKKWKSIFNISRDKHFESEKLVDNFIKTSPGEFPQLDSIGFQLSGLNYPSKEIDEQLIKKYDLTRDFPAFPGTSRLGLHLRFGTISIRQLVSTAARLNETFLNELIWREFYMMILWHFPHVPDRSFKPQYDYVAWRNNEHEFDAWCNGMTGYPIVDAGMRELNQTGFMHNRSRMITASFLAKHLLIDWRWGEAYFAKKLLDFELASNNGGWQWAAGTGCDAAPYFRVFNPDLQTEKFDPDNKYIKKWVPEFESASYPGRIVNHAEARNAAISAYKKALSKNI